MSDSFEKKKHTLFLENREKLELSGVTDVDSFNEEEINAKCDWGELMIKGSELQVDVLDLEVGTLKINGKITALVYNDKIAGKGFFGRMLS